jgi:hypothetical protein
MDRTHVLHRYAQDMKEKLQSCEEALHRSMLYSRALKSKVEFHRANVVLLEARTARDTKNIEKLTNAIRDKLVRRLLAFVPSCCQCNRVSSQVLQEGETVHEKLGLEETLERADGLKPLMVHASTMTEGVEDVPQLSVPSRSTTETFPGTLQASPALLPTTLSSDTPAILDPMYHRESEQLTNSSTRREESESHWPELEATAGGAGGETTGALSEDGRYNYSQYPWVYDYSTGEWQDWSQAAGTLGRDQLEP